MVGANEPSPLERAFLHVLRAYVKMGKVKLFTAIWGLEGAYV